MTILNIHGGDDAIYGCNLLQANVGIVASRFITITVLEWDSLAPRIAEALNPTKVVY